MKSFRVTALLCALAALCAALGALCGAVTRVATDESFYLDDSRRAVAVYLGREPGPELTEADEAAVTRYVGLTREEQQPVARALAADMRLPSATFEEIELLNADERQHMRDVRGIIRRVEGAAKTFNTLAAALALAAAWTAAGLAKRVRPALTGAAFGVGLPALLAAALLLAARLGAFAPLFVGMHELLFDNDLWRMNPNTDILIRMMPQPLFEAALLKALGLAAALLAVTLALLAALYALAGGMIRRSFERAGKT